jgi:hypothetical protein
LDRAIASNKRSKEVENAIAWKIRARKGHREGEGGGRIRAKKQEIMGWKKEV